jgi:hypothetical protein
MGINYDGNVYGIGWELYDENDNFIKKFEKNYLHIMTFENINEIKGEFNKLTFYEKKYANFFVYTSYQCTYETNSSREYVPYSINIFKLENFFTNGFSNDIL